MTTKRTKSTILYTSEKFLKIVRTTKEELQAVCRTLTLEDVDSYFYFRALPKIKDAFIGDLKIPISIPNEVFDYLSELTGGKLRSAAVMLIIAGKKLGRKAKYIED